MWLHMHHVIITCEFESAYQYIRMLAYIYNTHICVVTQCREHKRTLDHEPTQSACPPTARLRFATVRGKRAKSSSRTLR